MNIRVLLLALASATLLAGCVTTAGYGYGDGYYRAPGTVQYRSNRGYPYGGYGGGYRYGYPYGYGPGYGYRYDRYYYGAPGYYRPGYPHHHHSGGSQRPHRPDTQPSGPRPPSGNAPWRDLDKLRPPTQGRQIAPSPTLTPRPAPSARPPAPASRPAVRVGEDGARRGRDYYKRGGRELPERD